MEKLCTITPTVNADGEVAEINVYLPMGWSAINEEQLKYVLRLRESGAMSDYEVRICCFYRFCGIEERAPRTSEEREMQQNGYHFFRQAYLRDDLILPEWFMLNVVEALSWLDHPTEDVTRLTKIHRCYDPVEADFSNLSFGDYLHIENLWQSAMAWSATDDPGNEVGKLLDRIARILYKPSYWFEFEIFGHKVKLPRVRPFKQTTLMQLNISHWLTGWHLFAQKQWPNLFKPASGESKAITPELLREQVDLQIQALTGGDVTKVESVMQVDAWTALNMLDIKQRDAIAARKAEEKRQAQLNRKRH